MEDKNSEKTKNGFPWMTVFINSLLVIMALFIIKSGAYNTSIALNPKGFGLHLASAIGGSLPLVLLSILIYFACFKLKKKKEIFVVCLWLLTFTSIYGNLSNQAETDLSNQPAGSDNSSFEIDLQLNKIASKINQNLPMMLDSETRVDTSYAGNRTFTYVYTLVNYSADQIEPLKIYELLKEMVVNASCTDEQTYPFLFAGIRMNYKYLGKDSKRIITISVNHNDCEIMDSKGIKEVEPEWI